MKPLSLTWPTAEKMHQQRLTFLLMGVKHAHLRNAAFRHPHSKMQCCKKVWEESIPLNFCVCLFVSSKEPAVEMNILCLLLKRAVWKLRSRFASERGKCCLFIVQAQAIKQLFYSTHRYVKARLSTFI